MTDQQKYIDPKTGCPVIDPFQQILDKIDILSAQVNGLYGEILHEISIIKHDRSIEKYIQGRVYEK